MPCVLPGHAENVRKCIDANLSFCACFPSENNSLFSVRAMHRDAGSRVRTLI